MVKQWDSLSTETLWILKLCTKPKDIDDNVPISHETSPNQTLADENPQQFSSLSPDQSSCNTVSDKLPENQSTAEKQTNSEGHPKTGDE